MTLQRRFDVAALSLKSKGEWGLDSARLRHKQWRDQPQLDTRSLVAVIAAATVSIAIATDAGVQDTDKVIRKHACGSGGLQSALPPAAGHLLDPMNDGTFLEIQLVRLLGGVFVFDYCTDWKGNLNFNYY